MFLSQHAETRTGRECLQGIAVLAMPMAEVAGVLRG